MIFGTSNLVWVGKMGKKYDDKKMMTIHNFELYQI